MKKTSVNILIVSLLLMGVMGVMLIVMLGDAREDFKENITVSADGVTEEVLAVRDLTLTPTEKKTCTVNLVCAASGSYDVILVYEETKDGGMKPYVNVTVTCDDETVFEGSLATLLDSETEITFAGELHESETLPVTFTYEMPREIGNEAQGTYSDFDVHLTIEKS